MKPIALQLYSLRHLAKKDLVAVLKLVAEMGYVGVEPAGLYGNNPNEVRKVLDDLELVCCSTHGPLPTTETISRRVDEAAALGTDMIVSGLNSAEFETADAIKAGIDKLAAAAALAGEADMKFGYHNHWWEFDAVDGRTPYELIMRDVPEMFSQLDVYWAANFGQVDVPALLGKYAARVPLLHLKDGPLVRGEPHTAIGAGKMDIPAAIAATDDQTLQWLIVELDECATDMTAAVRESVAYLTGEGLGRGRK